MEGLVEILEDEEKPRVHHDEVGPSEERDAMFGPGPQLNGAVAAGYCYYGDDGEGNERAPVENPAQTNQYLAHLNDPSSPDLCDDPITVKNLARVISLEIILQ